jgi:hypothetical protein
MNSAIKLMASHNTAGKKVTDEDRRQATLHLRKKVDKEREVRCQ